MEQERGRRRKLEGLNAVGGRLIDRAVGDIRWMPCKLRNVRTLDHKPSQQLQQLATSFSASYVSE